MNELEKSIDLLNKENFAILLRLYKMRSIIVRASDVARIVDIGTGLTSGKVN